jgi:hypothetical protein
MPTAAVSTSAAVAVAVAVAVVAAAAVVVVAVVWWCSSIGGNSAGWEGATKNAQSYHHPLVNGDDP